ncbi:hypothetical protein CN221_37535, partial [Sinorhizobium meliloti]
DHDRETQSACSSSTRIYAYHTGCKPGEKFCDRTLWRAFIRAALTVLMAKSDTSPDRPTARRSMI